MIRGHCCIFTKYKCKCGLILNTLAFKHVYVVQNYNTHNYKINDTIGPHRTCSHENEETLHLTVQTVPINTVNSGIPLYPNLLAP